MSQQRSQHGSLSPERWSQFPFSRQVLMIGNEMHRTSKLMRLEDLESRRRGYERVLNLVDLTIEVQTRRGIRRELLRWRDLVAALYIDEQPNAAAHIRGLRCLLLMSRESARQIPFVCQ